MRLGDRHGREGDSLVTLLEEEEEDVDVGYAKALFSSSS